MVEEEAEEAYFFFLALLPALMMERAQGKGKGQILGSKIANSYRIVRVGVKMCFGRRAKHCRLIDMVAVFVGMWREDLPREN